MSPPDSSDEALIAAVRGGDEAALQQLVGRYQVRLADFAQSLLRRRDLADEAVANVFISLWRRRGVIVIRSSVRSYLFAAVGNQAINLRRSQIKAGSVRLEDVAPRDLADPKRSDSALLYREFQEEIDALLRKMPPQRQLVFRMNRIEGLRYWEIAGALCISEHTVQNHMVQAMRQLVQELPRLKQLTERSATSDPFG